jgi:ABC-type Fe3+/spermidine/putrescine transport system ATPase subunit
MAGISVRGLAKSFGSDRALSDIDFHVAPEEFCVIVGPSGSGKSTLLKCIAGVETPDTGTISIDDDEIIDEPVESRDMGLVFQEFDETLFPHKTVGDNVAFGLELEDEEYTRSEIEQQVDEILDLLAISHTRNQYPEELSGGQQQRVELARHLVRDCRVMLLDDALSDLDYKMKKEMEPELRQQHAESDAIFLYVTHNQDIALEVADKLIVLNHGQIEQLGTPREVYRNPRNVFVARFLGDSTFLSGTVGSVGEDQVVVETDIGRVAGTPVSDVPSSGDDAYLVIRPENISIGSDQSEFDNEFDCTVETRTYTGEETEFIAAVGDVKFEITEPGVVSLDDIGDPARLGWNAADIHIYTDDSLSAVDSMSIEEIRSGGITDE